MNFERGLNFDHALRYLIDLFYSVYSRLEQERDFEIRKQITYINLGQLYLDFTNELRENILEYQDEELIMEYLKTCFIGFLEMNEVGFSVTNKQIIRNQDNAGLLLKLKLAVEKYQVIINKWLVMDLQIPGLKIPLQDRFEQIQNEIKNMNFKDDPVCFDINILIEEKLNQLFNENCKDERFFIKELRKEYDNISTIAMKIEFVKKRIFEFNEWKLDYEARNDEILMRALEIFIKRHYYDFEEQCMIEIAELSKSMKNKTDLNPNHALPESIESTLASYTWHATDTDMLELSIALLKAEIVRRTDGRKITHDEMTGLLENTFGREIKDAKGKLTKAVARKKSVTPFLDSLKTAFEDYSRERDEHTTRQN